MADGYEPNPWIPMTDPVDCKHLLKQAEELGECSSATARCQMQGIDEREPVTGKLNREWLEDEIADVWATTQMTVDRFDLDINRIRERVIRKRVALIKWHLQAAEPQP